MTTLSEEAILEKIKNREQESLDGRIRPVLDKWSAIGCQLSVKAGAWLVSYLLCGIFP